MRRTLQFYQLPAMGETTSEKMVGLDVPRARTVALREHAVLEFTKGTAQGRPMLLLGVCESEDTLLLS